MAATAAGLLLCAHCVVPVGGPAQRVGYLDVYVRDALNCLLVILCRFPAEFVRYTAEETWFRRQKSTVPGVSRREKRAPGYSLLASSRVLKPQIPASLKVLLVPVTIIDKESLYSLGPAFFLKGVHLYCR